MLYQPDRLLSAISALPIMTVETGISVAQAAKMVGVSERSIRTWCEQWPGLARREGQRRWVIIDTDLLMDMAAARRELPGGQLKMSGRLDPPRKPAESPLPDEYTMSAATAARLLGVNNHRIYDWCRTLPEFGRRVKGDRGEWRINPRAALAWGFVRIGKRQTPRWADPDDVAADFERRASLLRQIYKTVRGQRPISDALLDKIRNELRRDLLKRKRTKPAASAAGEVRDDTR
jgi:hypothetical protein